MRANEGLVSLFRAKIDPDLVGIAGTIRARLAGVRQANTHLQNRLAADISSQWQSLPADLREQILGEFAVDASKKPVRVELRPAH